MSGAPFRVVRRLGRGGMAEVWLAEDARGAPVALKRVLPEHAADPRFRRMFLDEAAIAGALDHPGIVSVLASGEEDGTPWLALELVDGRDAAAWGELGRDRGAPMTELVALRIAADVARALHAAHEAKDEQGASRGIVHRDVTPGNVLVARDGTVKLGDFGIAKARDRLERTSVGATKGKMAFMAPEQMLGSELDRRTDVFALGCTMHALLTGRSAIGDERDGATLMSGDELVLDGRLADDVRAVIARAVAPSRLKRWPTASAMADAIDETLAERGGGARDELVRWLAAIDEQPVAAPSEVATRVARSAARRATTRAPAAAALALLAALGIGAGAAILTYGDAASGSQPVAPIRLRDAGHAAADAGHAAADGGSAASAIGLEVDAGRGAPVEAGRRGRARADGRDAPASALPVGAPPPSASPPSPEPPQATGFVVVGGAGATRRVVHVDGARRDFAPTTLELPIGRHTIEIREPEGALVATRTVDVRADHTRRSPVRWIVASE